MSRTFVPNNKQSVLKKLKSVNMYDDGSYDFNVAGCEIIGLLSRELGFNIGPLEFPNFPFKATIEQAVEWGEKIKNLDKERIHRTVLDYGLFDGNLEEFNKWCLEFSTWLKLCEGYSVL